MKGNPYIILGIPESATDSEIKLALKSKVDKFCGRDLSNKDIEGNYLFQMYNEAAKMLLNNEMRKEIDRILEKERESTSLIPIETKPNIKVNTKEDFISYINIELFKNNVYGKIKKAKIDDSKICVDNLYLLVGEDNSCIFVYQSYKWDSNYAMVFPEKFTHIYQLKSVFTEQVVAEERIRNYCNNYCNRYFDGKIFSAGNIKSYILPACKIIPIEFIVNCKIKRSDLIDIQNAIQYASREHPEVIKDAFKSKRIGRKI